jgi:hypothetical protein
MRMTNHVLNSVLIRGARKIGGTMEAHSARDESAGGKRSGRLITFSQHGARPAIEASGGQSAAEGQRPIQVIVAPEGLM